MPFIHADHEYPTDQEGYLKNLSDWSPELAEAMAQADGVTLSEGHWEVLYFLREYYQQYKVAPPIRVLAKAIGRRIAKQKGNSKYLYGLFPYGPAKQASRYAGLPKPTNCI